MKRILILPLVALLASVAAFAQPRAVGAYFSAVSEGVYYQHSLGEKQFLELRAGADIGLLNGTGPGFDAGIDYEFIFASYPKSNGTFNLWAGPGVHGGYGYTTLIHPVNDLNPFVSLALNFGFDFTFNKHLQLFAKLSPKVGVTWGMTHDSDRVNTTKRTQVEFARSVAGLIPELGVAYSF